MAMRSRAGARWRPSSAAPSLRRAVVRHVPTGKREQVLDRLDALCNDEAASYMLGIHSRCSIKAVNRNCGMKEGRATS